MSEKRGKSRRPSSGKVRVAWVEQDGAYIQEKPNLVDCSSSGMGILLNRRIELQTRVGIKTLEHNHITSAVVRHVTQKGLGFRIGLEFPSEVSGLDIKS